MTKKYYREYTLAKDLPNHAKGWPLRWDGNRRKYFFPKASTYSFDKGTPEIWLDYTGESYTIEQVESNPTWFKPVGQAADYAPKFPSKEEIDEYVMLLPETRLSAENDFCRSLQELLNDQDFKDSLYYFVAYKYEQMFLQEESKEPV